MGLALFLCRFFYTGSPICACLTVFFIFFNPIFPMHSTKIHTFALSFQKTTKCNQYETERCYNRMACSIHYQLYDAGGMHRKKQEAREEKRES